MSGIKNRSTLGEELGYIIIWKSTVGLEKWITRLKTQGDRRRIKKLPRIPEKVLGVGFKMPE